VGEFVRELARNLLLTRNNTAKNSNDVCPALFVLRSANKCHQEDLISLSLDPIFSEPQIAHILQKENPGQSPVFLSSSMACRDFDNFSGIVGSSSSSTRRVGCNRGANGIDGVLSTAVGYAYGCSSSSQLVTVLIGDIATLHDVTGIAIAAGMYVYIHQYVCT
jgi:2-succinyl-5-enolpyruvyl-6-hydroxy-3-cyclohexene-1-carboxylate synthase